METENYLLKQETIYWNSNFLTSKWYRKLFGGKWRLLKFGRDTPYIGMFCLWTKMDDTNWSGYRELLDEEEYPYTGVDTKWKLLKQFLKIN